MDTTQQPPPPAPTIDRHDLVAKVIDQIYIDLTMCDSSALIELLLNVPRASLIAYLPDGKV